MRFLFMKVKRKLVPCLCFCARLDVNGEHIVWTIMNSSGYRQEAMMDSFLSLLRKETNLEINNSRGVVAHVPLFVFEKVQLTLFCDALL